MKNESAWKRWPNFCINIPTACFMAFGYIVLSGVLAYEWGLCLALTGTIWAGAFEHFFNNFIMNSLHMVTDIWNVSKQI